MPPLEGKIQTLRILLIYVKNGPLPELCCITIFSGRPSPLKFLARRLDKIMRSVTDIDSQNTFFPPVFPKFLRRRTSDLLPLALPSP